MPGHVVTQGDKLQSREARSFSSRDRRDALFCSNDASNFILTFYWFIEPAILKVNWIAPRQVCEKKSFQFKISMYNFADICLPLPSDTVHYSRYI